MGDTVEIFVRHRGTGAELARRVAETLGLRGYFGNGHGITLADDGRAQLDVRDTEPDLWDGTAYARYEYHICLDIRGPRERLGRGIFDRLTALGLPMAYGTVTDLLADYRPGLGVREFPPGTAAEARVGPPPAPPAAPPRPAGDGTVTAWEAGGLLQFVPRFGPRSLLPVASVRAGAGARAVGETLAAALGTADRPGQDDRATVPAVLAGALRLPAEEFLRRAVSFTVRAEHGHLSAGEHARVAVTGGPEALGALVLEVAAGLRPRPVARTRDEALLYLGLRHCERCHSRDASWSDTVVDDAGAPARQYRGVCRRCGTPRVAVFRLPAHPTVPALGDLVHFGGPEPSELLDPGEWWLVAGEFVHDGSRPRTGDPAVDARHHRSFATAVAAYAEILKFVPPGADAVPPTSFRTPLGRGVYDRDPSRFRRDALERRHRVFADELEDRFRP